MAFILIYTHLSYPFFQKFYDTCPADAKLVTFTDAFKKLAVDTHNGFRNYCAGGNDPNHSAACRMPTMQWDDELAYLASLNVMQCKMSHDKCRNTAAYTYSGQNLAWMTFWGTPNYASMVNRSIEMWNSEIKDSKQEYIDAYPSGYSGP